MKFDIHRPSTYGEITTSGVRQLGRLMEMSSAGQDVVFMDLGSGVGKAVVQAYLEWPVVQRSIGVELARSRARAAMASWNLMLSSGRADQLREAIVQLGDTSARTSSDSSEAVQLLQGDMLHADVSDVTHLFVNSLCLTSEIMRRLAAKLSREASKLHSVVVLKSFPNGLTGFQLVRTASLEMSWSAGVEGKLYQRIQQ